MSPGYKNVLTVAMDYFVFQQIQKHRKLVLLLNDNIWSLSIIPTVKFTENNRLQTKVQYDKQLTPLKQSIRNSTKKNFEYEHFQTWKILGTEISV